MVDCEKCLHYNACQTIFVNFYSKTVARKTENCPNFTDKNKFVEVVRCKDCVHKVDYNGRTMCSRFSKKTDGCWYGLEAKDDEYFCSHGQRKEEK